MLPMSESKIGQHFVYPPDIESTPKIIKNAKNINWRREFLKAYKEIRLVNNVSVVSVKLESKTKKLNVVITA